MPTNHDGRQPVQYGDQQVQRGQGGETHQVAADGAPRLTTQQGTVVSDDQNTLRAGERGPSALEDFHFREKIFHFDHERIPERVVHARGYGAHGSFENYEPLTELTRADPFSEAGLRTAVRFAFLDSTIALTLALFINAAILIMSAATSGRPRTSSRSGACSSNASRGTPPSATISCPSSPRSCSGSSASSAATCAAS